jgi:hypothetical protein
LIEVGEDESHPLASFMEVVGILIEKYEDEHVTELACSNSLLTIWDIKSLDADNGERDQN